MVLLLPPLMLHGLPYHNSIIKTFSDLRSCRWISGIWKIRGSCRQRDHHTLRCSGTTFSRTLCKWVVNALDRRLCVLTSCVGTGTGSAAEVSKVWSDPTWSTSSGFSAGHHCVSNSCPAGCQKGGITSSVCGLTEDLIIIFFTFLGFCGNNLLYRAR